MAPHACRFGSLPPTGGRRLPWGSPAGGGALRCTALLLGLSLITGPALALDYRSVTEAAAMYDAPSQKAKPLHAIARGTPVEVVVSVEGWIKVRDPKGDLAWIEKRHLSDMRMVIVRVDRAQVRAQGDDKAALTFEAAQDVVLELLEPAVAGWARVRHRDGQAGYVKASQIWGL